MRWLGVNSSSAKPWVRCACMSNLFLLWFSVWFGCEVHMRVGRWASSCSPLLESFILPYVGVAFATNP